MATRNWRILSIVLVAAPFLPGQEGRVVGPNSGFVFDTVGHTLRPIRGIPGAATVGDPLDFGFDVASVLVAPRQDWAVVVATDASLHLFRITPGTVVERPIDGLSGVPERVAFSPSGTAAALYASGHLQIVNGLPDSPTLTSTLDLGVPSALAISDDGAYVLSAAVGSIRLLGTAGENIKVMDASDGALIAFAPGGHDAAVSDSGGAGLVWFRDLTGSSRQSVLASGDAEVASPVGLAFSADGRTLFVASSTARSVSTFDLATGNRAAIPCPCAPAGFVPMGNTFRLNELGSEPLWLLDTAAGQPRIVFVPALPAPIAN
ncbi:MAG: WD40 repeat domain-containing protein [Acidobacteriia bacterium]|nr:WD40 repeat domain-containing protein [Terriglobia bacterium]